jgi:hypothetical protein
MCVATTCCDAHLGMLAITHRPQSVVLPHVGNNFPDLDECRCASLGEGLQWWKALSHSMAQQGKQELWLVSARLTLRLFHFLTIQFDCPLQPKLMKLAPTIPGWGFADFETAAGAEKAIATAGAENLCLLGRRVRLQPEVTQRRRG